MLICAVRQGGLLLCLHGVCRRPSRVRVVHLAEKLLSELQVCDLPNKGGSPGFICPPPVCFNDLTVCQPCYYVRLTLMLDLLKNS